MTAPFVMALGAAGYGTKRDLSGPGRLAFFALLAFIVFGIVTAFAQIPNGSLVYSIAGLVIFACLTVADFQRRGSSSGPHSAPCWRHRTSWPASTCFSSF
jgi:FtsH-binding integral membrane protein